MPYKIAMVVPGLGFDGDSLETKALGGSETAAIYMARGLARLGHKVTVFATTNRPGIYHGVNYLPFERWDQAITHVPHDISILQRMLDAFAVPRAGKLNILWCHDLLTAEFAARLSAALPNTHGVFVVSDYMAEHYRAMARFRDGQLFVTANGLDGALISSVAPAGPRDPFHLFYSARPERGLDILLADVMPRVLAKEPRVRLSLATYENTGDELKPFYDICDRLAAKSGRARFLGHLSKSALYAQMKTAGIYAYPTPSPIMPDFAEVSCISVMEARACGQSVVTCPRGALPETVPDATFVEGEPGTPSFAEAFAAALIDKMHAPPAPTLMTRDWNDIAKAWDIQFARMMQQRDSRLGVAVP